MFVYIPRTEKYFNLPHLQMRLSMHWKMILSYGKSEWLSLVNYMGSPEKVILSLSSYSLFRPSS